MRVIDLINNSCGRTAFSFELLPPLKGNSIQQVFNVIDKLKEFSPKYINITSHHGQNIYVDCEDGVKRKRSIRRRPGSVAIAAAIQNRYGITAVPHIVGRGFTKEETEYALLDLSFLGVHDLLLLRGDTSKLDIEQQLMDSHKYATELQDQVNDFNKGKLLDDVIFDVPKTPFSYGMACYPEMHEESPNIESEIYYLKKKVENGADYLVTQMFFDNEKYFNFVRRCREEGVNVPIIPGIKPIHLKNQLNVLPSIFRSSIPKELATELKLCKSDEEAVQIGIEWCINQCKELIQYGVPSLHFYSFMASDSVYKVAKSIYR